MKSPTAGFQTAMAKTGTTPVWLLELNGNYYADRTISDGTNSYAAKVLEWADITEKNGRMNGGNMASATSITLHTDVYADVRLNNTANIYLWFENESLSASDRLLMFSGVVTDPISVTETEIVCSIKSIEESKDAVLGSLVETTTFPDADVKAVGEMLPVIYGDVYEHECLPLDAGVLTSLFADLTGSATSLEVSDSTGLENSDVVLIDDEQIRLGGKVGNTFTLCTRGYNSTVAVAHDRGADVVEKLSAYDFLIADHAITSLDAVYAKGVRMDSADYSLQTIGGRAYVRFTSHPKIVNSVDIDVDVTDDSIYTPEQYTVESYSAESVTDNITDPTTAQKGEDLTIISDESSSLINTQTHIVKLNFSAPVSGANNAVYTANLYLDGDVGGVKVATSTNTAAHDGYKTVMGAVSGVDGSTPISISTSTARQYLWVYIDALDSGGGLYYEIQSPTRAEEVVISISKQGQVNYSASSLTNSSLINSAYVAGSMPTTVTGNTSAGTAYTREITVDCTGYSSKSPDLVVKHLLETYGNGVVGGDLGTSLTADSEEFGNDYDLGFAITNQIGLMAMCRKVAYQSASAFHWDGGIAKLSRFVSGGIKIDNPKFEEGFISGTPNGWTKVSGVVTETTGYSGSGVKIEGNSIHSGELRQSVTLEVGETYDISLHYRSDGFGNYISLWTGATNDVFFSAPSFVPNWTLWEGSFTATASNQEIRLHSGTGVSDELFIDNIQIVKAGEVVSTITQNNTVLNTASMRWTRFNEMINHIDAQYKPINGKLSATHTDSDAISKINYGARDGSSKFKMDLIEDATVIGTVIDDYLFRFGVPRRIAELQCPLTHIDVERGDTVSIDHDLEGGWNGKFFHVLETTFIVGSGKDRIPDKIKIIAEEL